jgi:hypothetical protein
MWDLWKRGFTAWEQATAQYVEKTLANPGVIGPLGSMMTAVAKTKIAADQAMTTLWGALGIATKRDQERLLHKLDRLESQLHDLEETR